MYRFLRISSECHSPPSIDHIWAIKKVTTNIRYALSFPQVSNICSIYAEYMPNICSMCAQCVLNGCSMDTQWVLNGCSMDAQANERTLTHYPNPNKSIQDLISDPSRDSYRYQNYNPLHHHIIFYASRWQQRLLRFVLLLLMLHVEIIHTIPYL